MLSLREHSCYELTHKLLAKQFERQLIDDVVSALNADGYVDDQRFCEMFFRVRMQKNTGLQKISYELRQKGVDESLIRAVAANYTEDDWVELAAQMLNKKFGESQQSDDFKLKAKKSRFLQTKGFSLEQIRQVLR